MNGETFHPKTYDPEVQLDQRKMFRKTFGVKIPSTWASAQITMSAWSGLQISSIKILLETNFFVLFESNVGERHDNISAVDFLFNVSFRLIIERKILSFAFPRRLAEFSRLSLSSNSRTIHHRHQQPKRRARDENLSKQRGWLIEVGSIRAHKASSAEENLISPLGKLQRLEVEVEVLLIDLSGVIEKLRSASFRA